MKRKFVDPLLDGVNRAAAVEGTPWVVWTDVLGRRHEGPRVMQQGELGARDESNTVVMLTERSGRTARLVKPGSVRVFDADRFPRIVFTDDHVMTLLHGGLNENGTIIEGVAPDGMTVSIPLTSVRYAFLHGQMVA